ncbi:unnamed protein product [Heligmosomoides polygyrus]|uniref:Leishmanolysin-like peptidase n=1 Tax=Heligmosomoides polygyrus TaxID=6339 RepID=A0A3P8E9X7_HELPZ|nr:unnamed protein product [Heligmosomoides polygyrus]
MAKLSCNMAANLVNVPDEYNYNIGGLYTDMRGKVVNGYGRVEVADYCPYYRVVGEYSREDSDTRCTYPGNMHYNNYSLECRPPTMLVGDRLPRCTFRPRTSRGYFRETIP